MPSHRLSICYAKLTAESTDMSGINLILLPRTKIRFFSKMSSFFLKYEIPINDFIHTGWSTSKLLFSFKEQHGEVEDYNNNY